VLVLIIMFLPRGIAGIRLPARRPRGAVPKDAHV